MHRLPALVTGTLLSMLTAPSYADFADLTQKRASGNSLMQSSSEPAPFKYYVGASIGQALASYELGYHFKNPHVDSDPAKFSLVKGGFSKDSQSSLAGLQLGTLISPWFSYAFSYDYARQENPHVDFVKSLAKLDEAGAKVAGTTTSYSLKGESLRDQSLLMSFDFKPQLNTGDLQFFAGLVLGYEDSKLTGELSSGTMGINVTRGTATEFPDYIATRDNDGSTVPESVVETSGTPTLDTSNASFPDFGVKSGTGVAGTAVDGGGTSTVQPDGTYNITSTATASHTKPAEIERTTNGLWPGISKTPDDKVNVVKSVTFPNVPTVAVDPNNPGTPGTPTQVSVNDTPSEARAVSSTERAFVYGAEFGASLRVTERVRLDFSYQWLKHKITHNMDFSDKQDKSNYATLKLKNTSKLKLSVNYLF